MHAARLCRMKIVFGGTRLQDGGIVAAKSTPLRKPLATFVPRWANQDILAHVQVGWFAKMDASMEHSS